MIITPHFFAGAALGTLTDNYWLAFLLGFVSHFVLDAVPHLEPSTFKPLSNPKDPWPSWIYFLAFGEMIVAAALYYFLFHNSSKFILMGVGGLGSVSVDLIDNNPFRLFLHRFPFFKQLNYVHEKYHYNLTIDKWYWGLISQVLVVGGSLWFLLKKF